MSEKDTVGGVLREWMNGSDKFKSYDDLETAKSDPNTYIVMEDLDPFPFDLTDSELFDEVKRIIIEE